MTSPTTLARRKALREKALQARLALDQGQHRAFSAALVEHLDRLLARLAPQRLAFCWPWRAEPDLRDWVAGWLQAADGRVAALPVVEEKQAAMRFLRWLPGMPMRTDLLGIPCPDGAVEVRPQVLLVPLNAFDAAGYRLGYGGGYFDRTMPELDALGVGVGFELGRVASTLPQAHDRPLDWIVTERGAFAAQRALQQLAGEPRNMR